MKTCINQEMTIETEPKPNGDIHGKAKSYRMVSKEGKNWGEWELCDNCVKDHIKKGWYCNLIEKIIL